MSYGPLDMINESIWIYEDIVGSLQNKWREAVSISTLLLSSLPVLLTVGLASRYFGKLFYGTDNSKSFADISAYSFGFLSFFYFSFYALGAMFFIAENLGLESDVLWNLPGSIWVSLGGIILIPLITILVSMLVFLSYVINLEKKFPSKFKWKVWAMSLHFFIVFICMSYAATIPGAFNNIQQEHSNAE